MPALTKVLTREDLGEGTASPTVRARPSPESEARRTAKLRGVNRRSTWTRERVIEGLRRFQRHFGVTPVNTRDYLALTRSEGRRGVKPWPSFYGVLRHFATFREAWTAAGFPVDRGSQPWTELEDWYLREGAGFLTRVQLAEDLGRTPDAVHRRLYDLGLNTRTLHGWTVHALEQATGIAQHDWERHVDLGLLPVRAGTHLRYIDPADVAGVELVDWNAVTPELARDVRSGLLGRLAGQIAVLAYGPCDLPNLTAGTLAWLRRAPIDEVMQAWRLVRGGVT